MKAIKTRDTVKVGPRYAPSLYKFLFEVVEWELPNYLSLVGNKVKPDQDISHTIYIRPNFLLLPAYRYSPIPDDGIVKELGIEPEYGDEIRTENLSLFNVYKVVEEESNVSDVLLRIWFGSCVECKKVRIWEVGVGFIVKPEKTLKLYRYGTSINPYLMEFDDYFRVLKKATGKKYSNFSKRGRSAEVIDRMYDLENSMFAMLNFFYTLYTGGGIRDNTIGYNLLKPYMELLHNCGNTFENALSNINGLMVLIG